MSLVFAGGGGKVHQYYIVYVFLQDDVVTGTLTVRENLHFSAALRLPSRMTHTQRKERVDRVIEELGLKNCANQKVHIHVYMYSVHVYLPN